MNIVYSVSIAVCLLFLQCGIMRLSVLMFQYRNSSSLLIIVLLDLQYANKDVVEMIISNHYVVPRL